MLIWCSIQYVILCSCIRFGILPAEFPAALMAKAGVQLISLNLLELEPGVLDSKAQGSIPTRITKLCFQFTFLLGGVEGQDQKQHTLPLPNSLSSFDTNGLQLFSNLT